MTEEDDGINVSIEPPNIVVELGIINNTKAKLEYDIAEVMDIEGEADVEIIDSHWHGIVVEGPDGTEHIDLRDLDL